MILIVGLGNPGKKHKNTRHNIGFEILDKFKKENSLSHWYENKKLKAKISQGKIGRQKIILAKPQAFMNSSGISVKLLVTHCRLPVTNLFVVHDDLDISLGQIKISKAKSSAGHKGAQSVIHELGTKNFIRFRIGIQPVNNEQRTMNNKKIEKFVLEKFTPAEKRILRQVIKTTCNALKTSIKNGIEQAMNQYN